jgi:hypothetical protein
MFHEYVFEHRTLLVAGLILASVVIYAFKRRTRDARPRYYIRGHFLLGLGMAGFYYGATTGLMNGRLEIPFNHSVERVVQMAVIPSNATMIYGIGVIVAAAACISCALILLRA